MAEQNRMGETNPSAPAQHQVSRTEAVHQGGGSKERGGGGPVEVLQQGKTITLIFEQILGKVHQVEKNISLRSLPSGLKDGEGKIRISARDHSWNGGNPVTLEKDVIIDTQPPQVAVLGALHYVNQGGAGVVTYQTSEDTPVSGVQVGEGFYPGFALGKNRYLAYYAVPINASSGITAVVSAEDRAGNQTKNSYRLILKV